MKTYDQNTKIETISLLLSISWANYMTFNKPQQPGSRQSEHNDLKSEGHPPPVVHNCDSQDRTWTSTTWTSSHTALSTSKAWQDLQDFVGPVYCTRSGSAADCGLIEPRDTDDERWRRKAKHAEQYNILHNIAQS